MAKISLACSSRFGSGHGENLGFVTSKPGSENRLRFVGLNEPLKKIALTVQQRRKIVMVSSTVASSINRSMIQGRASHG